MSNIKTTKVEENVYSTQLANGLTIVSHQMPVESISVGAWIKVGSRNETSSEHGIAHFLEHMAFKGTKNRTAKQIVEQIENVGGDMNASTGIEVTSYYFRLLKEDLRLGVEILADILQNPLFAEEEMQKEKTVILQEIAATDDDPDDVLFDALIANAYENQAIGRSILGTKKSVKALTATQLKNFLKKHYHPENMTIAMAGGASHEELVKLATKYFSNQPKTAPIALTKAQFTANNIFIKKSLEQSYLLIGFESLNFKHPDFFAQQLLSQLLGGGMSSRLFQNIREQKGLCYSIYASSWGFDDTGLIFIYAAANSKTIDEVKSLIYQELNTLISTLEPTELARAKTQIRSSQLMSLESPVSRSEQIARQNTFYKKLIKIDEILTKLDVVTLEDVSRVAQNLFISSEKNLKPHTTIQLGR